MPELHYSLWLGPLLIAMDHHGKIDGNDFRLFFTGVSVKLTGSDKWIDAQ